MHFKGVSKRKKLYFRIFAVAFVIVTLCVQDRVLQPTKSGLHFRKCNFSQESNFKSRLERSQQAQQDIVKNRINSPNKFWYAIEPTWSCVNERRIGTHGDGGKYICDIESIRAKKERCIIYSFGSAGQDDFERALAKITACQIHIFDPTPRLKREMELRVQSYGAKFHSVGLGGSRHEINLDGIWQAVHLDDLEVMSLSEIMDKLNHTKIDILKVDIEGSEFVAFDAALDGCKLNAVLVLLEVHVVGTEGMRKIFHLVASLEACGYRMYHKEPNYQGCHGTKCVELAFTSSDCNSPFSKSELKSTHYMNLQRRKQFLKLRQKRGEIRNMNPRLFWDYYEPDTVCFSLERIGGLHPNGIYTCALPNNCRALLYGNFENIYGDFLKRCQSVEMHEIPQTIKFNRKIEPWSIFAVRFHDNKMPKFDVMRDITGQLRTSCSLLNFDLVSIEMHWDFDSKTEVQAKESLDSIHELFGALESCKYAIYHKEPNLHSGRGHRYIMYSWIKFDLIIKEWERILLH